MSTHDILWAPDRVLKTTCTPVADIGGDTRQFLDDMLETMYAAPGIGLAAPQVGLTTRMFVIDVSHENEERQPLKVINPEIVWSSDEVSSYEEGCLSLPGHYAEITRPARITMRFFDETGAEQRMDAEGLLATCLQHEIDHLNGVLFIDHISSLKRNMILKKMIKAKKQRAKDEAA